MVIDIPSDSEPSNATVIFGFPIEQEKKNHLSVGKFWVSSRPRKEKLSKWGGIQGFLICLIIKNHPSLGKSKVSNWVEKEKLSKCGNIWGF